MPRSGTRGPISATERRLDIARVEIEAEILYYQHAFFCKRTMLVHFFSSSVSYFFTVAASKASSGRLNSSLRAVAVFGKLVAERYAIIDLCLWAKVRLVKSTAQRARQG